MARTILLALLAAWKARAQISTYCSSLRELEDCAPTPAIGGTVTCDFREGKCDHFDQFHGIQYDEKNGAQLVIRNYSDAPTLVSNGYLFFGIIEFEMKASPGTGIATSFVLQSDVLDEIDIDAVGSRDDEVHTNFFAKGYDYVANRDGRHAATNVTSSFHNYTVKWTSRSISWAIDGQEFRVEGRNPHDVGDTFPQTPAVIRLRTWVAGGPTMSDETVEWAGGKTDLMEAPFIAHVRRITITDFAGGEAMPQKKAKHYEYANRNGTWQSINVVLDDKEDEMPIEFGNTTAGEDGTAPIPGDVLGTTMSTEDDDNDGKDNGTWPIGTIIGVVGGCGVAIMLIIVAIFLFWRRRVRRSSSMVQEATGTDAATPGGNTKGEMEEAISPVSELHGRHWEGWREGKDAPREVHGDVPPAEMNGESMPGELNTEREPVELDSAQVIRGL